MLTTVKLMLSIIRLLYIQLYFTMHKHILSSYSYVAKLETMQGPPLHFHTLSYSYRFNVIRNGTYNFTFEVFKS